MKKNTQEEMKKFQEEMKNIQEDMKKNNNTQEEMEKIVVEMKTQLMGIQGKVEELNFCKGKDKEEAMKEVSAFCSRNPKYNCK